MNYQEAREIVSDEQAGRISVDARAAVFIFAKGYLEAHVKAEKLVKALEKIIQKYPEGFDYLYNGEEVRGIARDVLDEWRQSNGVGKP